MESVSTWTFLIITISGTSSQLQLSSWQTSSSSPSMTISYSEIAIRSKYSEYLSFSIHCHSVYVALELYPEPGLPIKIYILLIFVNFSFVSGQVSLAQDNNTVQGLTLPSLLCSLLGRDSLNSNSSHLS